MSEHTSSTCRMLAPEDIVRGMYVVVLGELDELVMLPCFEDAVRGRATKLRVEWMSPSLEPLEVVDACLPLVMVRTLRDEVSFLDARRHRLARLPGKVGRRLTRRARRSIEKAERAAKAKSS